MKIILPPKCGITIQNPGDEPITIITTKAVVQGRAGNPNHTAIMPGIELGDEVIWIK